MTNLNVPLPEFLSHPSKIGNEISITGKWSAKGKSSFFRPSNEFAEMLSAWDKIHEEVRLHKGILSTEINPAIGQHAVLIHHVFENVQSLLSYFDSVAKHHEGSLFSVARPEMHMIRGIKIEESIRSALTSKSINGVFGEYLFGYVKQDYLQPDPEHAVQVTAKWKCKNEASIEELIYCWQRVGTDAFDMEKRLVRFEVFRVPDENALLIHETFENSDELQFHLTKGTANKYKKNIDKIANPENYFFRGPVSWLIRTYSKFMHLPATYTGRGSHYTAPGGSMSEGLIK